MFEIIGYNFNFINPINILEVYYNSLLRSIDKINIRIEGNKSKAKEDAAKEVKQVMKDIVHRFFLQVYQVAIDSAILPLALYFEPNEIAAACIAIGSHLFRQSQPVFQTGSYGSN